MKHRGLVAVICIIAAGLAGDIQAQHTDDEEHPKFHSLRLGNVPSPPARIDAMAWLAGRWTGQGHEGGYEEIWSQPKGGVMIGMCRQLNTDRTAFYEFMMLTEKNGTLVLKLRHFNENFSGWEDKQKSIDLPLVRVANGAVHFDGLSFIRRGADALTIYLQLYDRNTGLTREEELALRRR